MSVKMSEEEDAIFNSKDAKRVVADGHNEKDAVHHKKHHRHAMRGHESCMPSQQ